MSESKEKTRQVPMRLPLSQIAELEREAAALGLKTTAYCTMLMNKGRQQHLKQVP